MLDRIMPSFSIFLPVYNEQGLLVTNTEKLLQYLNSLHAPYEVLIGSNGSVDSTIRLGEDLQRRHPEVCFFHIPEKGPGLAIRKAIDLMRYDNLITLDIQSRVQGRQAEDKICLLLHFATRIRVDAKIERCWRIGGQCARQRNQHLALDL